ncbi:glycosyltransferase [Alteribacter aurantiacus]|uniref:glycosyltransferase n=1 Tax=Alteribacter aurantiacus TaxID=254410 RepID=UPI0003F9F869|nr:glycosyltransferase [Alteribacter aurantiacus]
MRKIRILFFIYQMGAGGAARTLLNIINNLDRSRYEPILVTLDFEGSYESELESDVTLIKLDTKRLSRSVLKLSKIIRREKIDIVFSTIPRVNTIAILANKLSFTKAKNIVREADNLSGGLKVKLQLRFFGLVYKRAHQIVSLSQGVKDNLIKRYNIKREDIKVVYNPIDVKAINKKIYSQTLDKQYTDLFKTDEKVIITAGRLVEQKDQATLFKAFKEVAKKIPSKLVILGEGPLEKSLKELARDLGVEGNVHFIGFQSNPYLFFSKADIFVLSSKHEGFSHVIAEALACGTPVVSTNCKSGPEEVLDHGAYGYLCNVGDATTMASHIEEVLNRSIEEQQRWKEKGFARTVDFDATKIVKQYEEVIEETLLK